jgi:hypothetical protein
MARPLLFQHHPADLTSARAAAGKASDEAVAGAMFTQAGHGLRSHSMFCLKSDIFSPAGISTQPFFVSTLPQLVQKPSIGAGQMKYVGGSHPGMGPLLSGRNQSAF